MTAPKMLTVAELAGVFDLSIQHMRKVVKQPGFPLPVRIVDGARPRWLEGEIQAFIAQRIAERSA